MLSRSSRALITQCVFFGRASRPVLLLAIAIGFGIPSIHWSTLNASNLCVVQAQPADGPSVQQQPAQTQSPVLEKALKYHAALLRRPNPGYLFDRFYNTWLDTSSLEELCEFLVERANASRAEPADRLLLAFFFAKQGKDVEALQQFQAVLKDNPDNASTLYEMAVIQARTLDYESALENLGRAAESKPASDEGIKIAQLQGKLLVQNRQVDEATKVWDELIDKNPDDLGLMEDLIELQVSESLFSQAETLSDRLIAKTTDPFQKVMRQLRKGEILQRSGSKTKALDVYVSTLAQVGMNTWIEREILSEVEQAFRREEDVVGLNKYLVKLIEANNRRVEIRKTRSKILVELGKVDEAIEVYEKVIELTPGSRENREAFTNLLKRAGKIDRAIKQVEVLVDQHPKDAELQLQLAELCNKISARTKAKAALEKFISLSGSTEYSFLRAAGLFEKFEDLGAAKAVFETALDKFPGSDSIKESWADFLFRSDLKEEAVKVWQTLAKGSDRAGLVRLARMLSVRKLNQVALDVLLARYDEFKLDSIYLGQLCSEAITLEQFPQAVEWATERVRLAKTSGDVETALPPAILLITSANQTDSVFERLQNKKNRTAAETCLLVEMLEQVSLAQEAEALLLKSLAASKAAKNNQDTRIFARQRVRSYRGRQRWAEAAVAASELLDLPGGRTSPNVQQLVKLHSRADDNESALKWIAEWKRLSPNSSSPWLSEATLLEQTGEEEASIATLRQAARLFPEDSGLFERLAKKYRDTGQAEEAQHILWRQYEASQKLADKIRWAEQLARLAKDEGKIDQLVKSFQERRKNNPQSIVPLISIALTYRISGDLEKRLAALSEASRLKRDDLSLLVEIARQEESEGDWKKAVQTLERASLLDKTNHTDKEIARLYFENHDTEEGLARLLKITSAENLTANEVVEILQTIARGEYWEELVKLTAASLSRFPDNYQLSYLSAVANEELGNTKTAKDQFLKLLQVNQLIPAQRTSNNQTQSQANYLDRSWPQSAVDLQQILLTIGSGYSYRPANSYQYNAGLAPKVGLPSNPKSCRELSLDHLRGIARDLPQKELDELGRRLEQIGVEDAKILLADVSAEEIRRNPAVLLELDPDSKAALAIAVLSTTYNVSLPQDTYLTAFETFKTSSPGISFIAATQLDQYELENQTYLTEAINRIKSIEEPGLSLVSSVSNLSRSSRNLKQRETLNQLLFDWYPKLASNPQLTDKAFSNVASALSDEESPKRLIEFLDQELVRLRTRRKPTKNHIGITSYNQAIQNSPFPLPVFPPNVLPVFPSNVYGQLNLPTNKVEMAISTAKNPTLKALLQLIYFHQLAESRPKQQSKHLYHLVPPKDSTTAVVGDQVTDSKSAITQLLDKSKTNVDAWYLAATLAVSEKRWEDAAASFETMRSLPLTAQTRRTVDRDLVALATAGLGKDLNDKKHESVFESAKAAALRLRRGTSTPDQKDALLSALERLGLNDEAEEMESQIWQAANGSARGSSSGLLGQQIQVLKQSGETEAIIRLLTREFRRRAREELSLKTPFRSQWTDFNSAVASVPVRKQIMARLDPGKSTSISKLGAWAFAQETFGDKLDAERAYKKALQYHPQDDAVRLRYVLLNPQRASQLFTLEFPKVSKQLRAAFLDRLINRLRGRFSPQHRLSLIESVIDYKEGDDGDSIDDVLMVKLLQAVPSSRNIKVGNVNQTWSIYTNTSKEEPVDQRFRGIIADIEQQRILHDRIALGLIDSLSPGQAAMGFANLMASAEAAGKPIDERMIALALEAAYAPRKVFANPYYFRNRGYVKASVAIKRTPAEFLARYYGYRDAANDEQIESIAEKLELLSAKDAAAQLRNIYRLCRASDDEFFEAAGQLIQAAKGRPRRPNLAKWRGALSTVFEIWKERQMRADISDLWIDFASQNSFHRNIRTRPGKIDLLALSPVTEYLNAFSESNDLPAIENFLTRLRLRLLGNEEQQRNLTNLLVNEEVSQRNAKKLEPKDTYFNIAKSLKSRKTFWLEVRERERFRTPNSQFTISATEIFQMLEAFKTTEMDSLIEWLGQSSTVADLKGFDPYYYPTRIGVTQLQESAWGNTLAGIGRQPESWRAELAIRLTLKSNRTFGENLLLSVAEGKPANIYQLLGSNLDTFDVLPLEQRIQLSKFASAMNASDTAKFGKKLLQQLSKTREYKAAKLRCERLKMESERADVAKVMAAKRVQDLGLKHSSLADWGNRFLASKKSLPPEELLAAVSKIGELSSDSQVRTGRQRNASIESELIEVLIGREVSTNSLKLILASLENDDMKNLSFKEEISNSVMVFFFSKFQSAKRRPGGQDSNQSADAQSLNAMKRLVAQLGGSLGNRDLIPLFPELIGFCSLLKDADSKAVDGWLHSDDEVKYPEIKKSLRLAFDCNLDIPKKGQAVKELTRSRLRPIETRKYYQEILDFLDDDSNMFQAKYRVAVNLLRCSELSGEGVGTCCQVIAQAYDAGNSLDYQKNQTVLRALSEAGDSPDINATRIAFAKSWIRSGRQRGGKFQPSSVLDYMNMLASTKDKSEVIKFLKATDQNKNPGVAVKLVELGYFKEAKKRLGPIWSDVGFLNTGWSYNASYTSELESKLPAFLKLLDDDGRKYFAEVYFASLRNSRDEKGIETTRISRLTALAKRLPTIEFKSKRERQLSVIIMLDSLSKSNELDQLFTSDLSVETFFEDSEPRLNTVLLGRYLNSQIQQRNFEPVQAKWKEINRYIDTHYPDGLSGRAKNDVDSLALTASRWFDKQLTSPPGYIAKLLPVLLDLNNSSYQVPLDPNTLVLAHLLTGRADELTKYMQERLELAKATNGPTLSSTTLYDLLNSMNSRVGYLKNSRSEEIATAVTSTWKFAQSQGYPLGPPKVAKQSNLSGGRTSHKDPEVQGIEQLAKLKLLSDKQILALGPKLAEINSYNGQIWLQLARRQAAAGQNRKASESFKKSFEEASDVTKNETFNRRLEYAFVLVKLKRKKEARELIQDISAEELDFRNQDRFRVLEQLLEDE